MDWRTWVGCGVSLIIISAIPIMIGMALLVVGVMKANKHI